MAGAEVAGGRHIHEDISTCLEVGEGRELHAVQCSNAVSRSRRGWWVASFPGSGESLETRLAGGSRHSKTKVQRYTRRGLQVPHLPNSPDLIFTQLQKDWELIEKESK